MADAQEAGAQEAGELELAGDVGWRKMISSPPPLAWRVSEIVSLWSDSMGGSVPSSPRIRPSSPVRSDGNVEVSLA